MNTRYWPMDRGLIVTSLFGPREDGWHWGLDIGWPFGSGGRPVYAMAGGRVDRAGPARGFGRWVCIDHPAAEGGGYTVYGHIVPEVSVGQRIEAGQRIAHVDPDSATNAGVKPHVHIEVHEYRWVPPGPGRLDPLLWLRDSGAIFPDERPSMATVFGIDISNHQRAFDFAAARAEGFSFATHKISQGSWVDPWWPRAREQMQIHFPNRWGGYVYCDVGTKPELEADTALAHSGGACRLQIDYEDLDRDGSIEDLHARVTAFTDRGFELLPIYLPRWYWISTMGSPSLAELPVGIWNSHYVTGEDYAPQLYPGDNHPGWEPMGGKAIAILQFSSTAHVAGQLIDVNAVRGGEPALAALFGKDTDMTPDESHKLHEIHRELTQLLPSRSRYRDTDQPTDTVAGYLLNVDGRVHESSIDLPAALDRLQRGIDELPAKIAAALHENKS
ncbi:peptidoglycan DD-metalloendopeptidase family protein [Nocardia altamirensis]|uniref:peptidoglycan DD-metalloendopeptidase family protein n=1 Tax=Nocardia altamirensis TaxID=472158 RepID=UPI00083FDF99|nr:peptidoglycan DD-metalloendopeptidase family protein [Nocardia altamirensis]